MLESILSVLENILNFIVNTVDKAGNLLDQIGDSVFNISVLIGSNLLPSFLVSSIVVVSSIHVIKLIVTLGGYHE